MGIQCIILQLSSKSEIIRWEREGSPDDQVEINAPLSYQNYYRLYVI